jgi:hypothetical protein
MGKVQMQVTINEAQVQEAICDYIRRLIPNAIVMEDIDYSYEDDNGLQILDAATVTVNIDLPPNTQE